MVYLSHIIVRVTRTCSASSASFCCNALFLSSDCEQRLGKLREVPELACLPHIVMCGCGRGTACSRGMSCGFMRSSSACLTSTTSAQLQCRRSETRSALPSMMGLLQFNTLRQRSQPSLSAGSSVPFSARWQPRWQKTISCCRVPVDSPQRFLVDVQFSAGANYDPFSLDPLQPHVLPVLPRRPLHSGTLYQPGVFREPLCSRVAATLP